MGKKRYLAGLAAVLLSPGSGSAAEPAWAERGLPEHLSLNQLAAEGEPILDFLIERGRVLFAAKFTTLDGAGRPGATQAIVPTRRKRPLPVAFARTHGPDANACGGCHNDPVPGAAGEFVANVFVSEGFESADFDTIDGQFSNERNTNLLQGSGLIELLAREMTGDLHRIRAAALADARASGRDVTAPLATKGVDFGSITASPDGMVDITRIDGVDTDLVVRPFSQKGVFTSLRQFTINALNVHHGMQATERFGARWTGTADFDGDGVEDEVSDGDVSAMVAWQASLAVPGRWADVPRDWAAVAEKGERIFGAIGCAGCHRPALPLESTVFTDPGPYDGAGTLKRADVARPIAFDFQRFDWARALPRDAEGRLLVPLFGDLKRHQISDQRNETLGNELFPQRFVARDVFMTAELWGVGSTAPYGHRGDITTIDAVVRAHAGEATAVTKAYAGLTDAERQSVVAFLKTLVVEAAP